MDKIINPLISIITPSYNQGKFIEETIRSILFQDYPNIEHIVVDGGSTDNTLDVLRKYDDKIRWSSEKDNGQSDALNKGFKMAKGEILGWLNSDDTYLPGAINKVMEYFKNHPEVGMIYGKTSLTDEFGNITGNFPTEPFVHERFAAVNFIAQSSVFIRNEVYHDAGGVSLDLRYAIDYDLWMRIFKITKIEYLPEFLSTYRLHPESGSVSEKTQLKAWEESLRIALKNYNWAPINRVYMCSYYLVKQKLPGWLVRVRPLVIFIAILVSLIEYVRLNRGIRLKDLLMITPANIRKMFTKK